VRRRAKLAGAMPLESAAAIAAALDTMPVFPLRGVVLFPGAALPLHVFEPRYRAMLADSLATHRCIAMALIDDETAPEPPPIARVAGAGIVVEHQPLPDGRSNIVLLGCARVRLDELPFVAPYRRARARVVEDVATPVAGADRAALHAAAAAFLAQARRLDIGFDFALPREDAGDAAAAADLYAHHLIVDARVRQRALEQVDIAARVTLVTTELAAQRARLVRDRRGPTN
jgi:Lon protease-like protein